MSMYLYKTVNYYRGDTEQEVENFLKELKEDGRFEIGKYTSTKKTSKDDEWVRFEVTKLFNDEKNPDRIVTVEYEVD